jgi:hypothetical protein
MLLLDCQGSLSTFSDNGTLALSLLSGQCLSAIGRVSHNFRLRRIAETTRMFLLNYRGRLSKFRDNEAFALSRLSGQCLSATGRVSRNVRLRPWCISSCVLVDSAWCLVVLRHSSECTRWLDSRLNQNGGVIASNPAARSMT